MTPTNGGRRMTPASTLAFSISTHPNPVISTETHPNPVISTSTHPNPVISTEGGALCRRSGETPVLAFAFALALAFASASASASAVAVAFAFAFAFAFLSVILEGDLLLSLHAPEARP